MSIASDKSSMPRTVETKPKNGTKTPETPKAEVDSGEEEKKARGVVPLMPAAIIYQLGGKVHAVIHHPVDGSVYAETGKGEGSAIGALVDSGFRLSLPTQTANDWLVAKLPEGAKLIGYCTIKSFPLPKQE